jgi:YD repeat-containing protein
LPGDCPAGSCLYGSATNTAAPPNSACSPARARNRRARRRAQRLRLGRARRDRRHQQPRPADWCEGEQPIRVRPPRLPGKAALLEWRGAPPPGRPRRQPLPLADQRDRKYGPGGRIEQANGTTYELDADGFLTKKTLSDGATWKYAWDAHGQLIEVARPDGGVVKFTYDAFGRRTSKTYAGKTTEYVWDGDDLVHERVRGEDGEVASALTTWVFEPGTFTPVAKIEGRKRYGIVTDHLGSPTMLATEAGKIAWKAQLDVYGVPRRRRSRAPTRPARASGPATPGGSPGSTRTKRPGCITTGSGTTIRAREVPQRRPHRPTRRHGAVWLRARPARVARCAGAELQTHEVPQEDRKAGRSDAGVVREVRRRKTAIPSVGSSKAGRREGLRPRGGCGDEARRGPSGKGCSSQEATVPGWNQFERQPRAHGRRRTREAKQGAPLVSRWGQPVWIGLGNGHNDLQALWSIDQPSEEGTQARWSRRTWRAEASHDRVPGMPHGNRVPCGIGIWDHGTRGALTSARSLSGVGMHWLGGRHQRQSLVTRWKRVWMRILRVHLGISKLAGQRDFTGGRQVQSPSAGLSSQPCWVGRRSTCRGARRLHKAR